MPNGALTRAIIRIPGSSREKASCVQLCLCVQAKYKLLRLACFINSIFCDFLVSFSSRVGFLNLVIFL